MALVLLPPLAPRAEVVKVEVVEALRGVGGEEGAVAVDVVPLIFRGKVVLIAEDTTRPSVFVRLNLVQVQHHPREVAG